MKGILIGLLVLASLSLYYFIVHFPFQSKRRRILSEILHPSQKENKLKDYLNQHGWLKYISPSMLMEEANSYEWQLSKMRFWTTFFLGTAIGVVMFETYFANMIFSCLGIVGGFLLVNFQIHQRKKIYKNEIEDKLGIYLRTVATTMGSYSNVYDAIKIVLPDLEDPIKKDVDAALLKLQQGSSIKEAFYDFNHQYPYNEVQLFHEMLDVINDSGTENVEPLRIVANKFKKKKSYRRKIETITNQFKKHVKTMSIFTLSLPFLFMLQSYDNYRVFSGSIAGKIVMALSLFLVVISFVQVDKLSIYDPTEDYENLRV